MRTLVVGAGAVGGYQQPAKLEVIFCIRGVISPLLANIYLHYAFDLWVQH